MGIVEVGHPVGPPASPSRGLDTHHEYEDLDDLLSDPPTGPLDHYRHQASFNWKQLRLILEEPEFLRVKMSVWKSLAADPIFRPPLVTPIAEEQKRVVTLQLRRFLELGVVPTDVHSFGYKKKTLFMMAVNAALASWNKCLSVKFGLGISLFTNALLNLGTERHYPFYDAVWNSKCLFALGMTEVGHGSNTKSVRTTATYDAKSQEFVIHTPDFEAAKCWIGNLGKTSTHTMLFAQLITGGVCHGLHAFLVPIRDPQTLIPYPGIKVGDIGEKAGLNGIDNGFILFNHYRIPRENLLNRTGDVTEDGEYESCFQNPEQILGAALEVLSAGRVAISQESSNDLCAAVTIAVRYAAVRKQFGPRESNGEQALLEYPLHQWRLFPYVAAACAYKAFVADFTNQYLSCVERSCKGGEMEDLTAMAAEVHAIVSALKPSITWTCAAAIQESREACGGHGYLKASTLGTMREDHDATVTYEGDNNVLLQQTSTWLILRWRDVKDGNPTRILETSPLGSLHFLAQADIILKRRFLSYNANDVTSPDFVKAAYEWLLCWILQTLDKELVKLQSVGRDRFTARNETQAFYAKPLSLIYAEVNALSYFWNKFNSPSISSELQSVMQRLYVLYGLWGIHRHVVFFYQGGFAVGPHMANAVQEGCQVMCSQLKPDIVSIVDAIALPDVVLKSVLGQSDGKVYEHLQNAFMSQNGVLERASWWHEVAVKTQSKL